jgi:hypothetical protein
MALQVSGPISFSQIANEFGTPSGKNIGDYRVSLTVGSLTNLPLDNDIPQSGSISFGDFYGKRLNVVVDLHSIANNSTRLVARSRYDLPNNGGVTVIGGFKGKPPSGSGSRVIINLNKTVGSEKVNINNVALRTGSWENNTNLELEIGTGGQLFGAGGNGGAGNQSGSNGTSALGIDYPTIIKNQGYIQAGGGGGAGSVSVFQARRRRKRFGRRNRSDFTYPSNGGGGGGGLPTGDGGSPNGSSAPNFTTGGSGGDNGSGSNGGNGGSDGGNGADAAGGSGGSQGRAIIIFNNGSGTTINGVPITSVTPGVGVGGASINGPIILDTNPT